MESSQVEAENDVGPVESTISEAGGALHITEKESGIQDMSSQMNSVLTSSQTSLLRLSSEPAMKRIKLEGSLSQTSLKSTGTTASTGARGEDKDILRSPSDKDIGPGADSAERSDNTGVVSPEQQQPASARQADAAPLKATKFGHLRKKYLHELEYMLTEFRKLERQLLGAKAATRESAGSRERREKLHSFILHLEDTIQQVHTGCQLEAEGKSTLQEPLEDSGLVQLTREKIEEENVQKLEEHILANLLPVKMRLKKQLAAQQGAKHNPAGMPVRGVASQQQEKGKGTFAAAAEEKRRKSLELSKSTTQFGKPLEGGGSNLTQKLHGQTLGSTNRVHGDGVGSSEKGDKDPASSKILYAGLALGSDHLESSVDAARTAHKLVINDPSLFEVARKKSEAGVSATAAALKAPEQLSSQAPSSGMLALTEDQRRRLKRKKLKKKRKMMEEQQKMKELEAKKQPVSKRKKGPTSKKRGPRTVEYMCAHCNEVYPSTCDFNPWWALQQQECPKCRKLQIPRVDISAPANAIEYHPALLAHADDNAGGAAAHSTSAVSSMHMPPSHLKGTATFPAMSIPKDSDDSDSLGSDLSDEDWDVLLSDGDSLDSDMSDSEMYASFSPSELAENERFGAEYTGPRLSDFDSARMLILMTHASTCPCQHKNLEHKDVCRSTKWMMLHVRDCPGTTSSCDVCPFPWCRKIKHLMYHLVSCQEKENCHICKPRAISSNLARLAGLNEHRLMKYREKLIALVDANTTRKNAKESNSQAGTSKRSVAASRTASSSKPSQCRVSGAPTPKTTVRAAVTGVARKADSKPAARTPSLATAKLQPANIEVKTEASTADGGTKPFTAVAGKVDEPKTLSKDSTVENQMHRQKKSETDSKSSEAIPSEPPATLNVHLEVSLKQESEVESKDDTTVPCTTDESQVETSGSVDVAIKHED